MAAGEHVSFGGLFGEGLFGGSQTRSGFVPEQQPRILIAALREGMLRLAGREGDGAIINWLGADDVTTVVLGRKNYEGFGGSWPTVAVDDDADPRDRGWAQ